MELFDIVDENGIPTGEIVERTVAHRNGVRHRTSHVWIVRKHGMHTQILLQKRCKDKDSFPGCYDISSAGHIPHGENFLSSALRELKEELGITATEEALLDCGLHSRYIDRMFHGKRFVDNQISRVFLLWNDMEEWEFEIQKEEIESIHWFDLEECKKMAVEQNIPNCIDLKELALLEAHIQ